MFIEHSVPNPDFVVFWFDPPVFPQQLSLVPFRVNNAGPDSDFQAWAGRSPKNFSLDDLVGLSFAKLESQLELTKLDENTTTWTGKRMATFSPSNIASDLLILRAGVDTVSTQFTAARPDSRYRRWRPRRCRCCRRLLLFATRKGVLVGLKRSSTK